MIDATMVLAMGLRETCLRSAGYGDSIAYSVGQWTSWKGGSNGKEEARCKEIDLGSEES